SDAGFPENRSKTQNHSSHGHELGAKTLNRAVDCGLLQSCFRQRNAFCEAMLERLMQVDNHDDAGLDGDAEERDVADPHSYAEVVPEKPLQQEATRQGVDGREDE